MDQQQPSSSKTPPPNQPRRLRRSGLQLAPARDETQPYVRPKGITAGLLRFHGLRPSKTKPLLSKPTTTDVNEVIVIDDDNDDEASFLQENATTSETATTTVMMEEKRQLRPKRPRNTKMVVSMEDDDDTKDDSDFDDDEMFDNRNSNAKKTSSSRRSTNYNKENKPPKSNKNTKQPLTQKKTNNTMTQRKRKNSTTSTSTTTIPKSTNAKKPRIMKDSSFQKYTLVRGLRRMIRPKKRNQLMKQITDLVPLISKAMVLGSRHAHIRLMELVLSRNDNAIRQEFTPDPILRPNGTLQKIGYIVERDFNPTKRTDHPSRVHTDQLNDNFRHYLDINNIEIPYLPYGVRCHNYATEMYCTSFHNNIRFRAYNRIRSFFNIHSNDYNLKRRTLRYLFITNEIEDSVPDERLLKLYNEVLRPLLPRNNNNRIPRGWLDKSLKDRDDWYRHVYEFINLQIWIYEQNVVRRSNGTDSEIRSFTTIPQSQYKLQHLTIDTRALATIANSFETHAEKTKYTDYKKSDVATRSRIWNKYFNITVLNKKMRYFDMTMTTDGVSAHFVMVNKKKIQSKRQILNADGNEISPEIVGYIDERITRNVSDDLRNNYKNNQFDKIIGYDPGYKLPVAIVRRDLRTNEESRFTMHWREFHKMCDDPRRRQKRYKINGKHENKMRDLRENRNIYPEQPSNRSPDYWTYIDYQMRTFKRCCKVYMRRSIARLTFDKYISTQFALQKIAKLIVGTDRCILAVGDFKFSANSPIRGSVRCPMRGLFNVLAQKTNQVTVIEIDEFRTSKLCSICGSIMQKKGRGCDRYYICKNNKPAASILPRARTWTAQLHPDRVREKLNKLPVAAENNRPQQRLRDLLNEQHRYVNSDNPKTVVIDGKTFAKHRTIVWNRDINAPRNIIYKLWCKLNNEQISSVFDRPKRQPLQQQQQQQDENNDDI